MFVHISPEPDAVGETISTLKFAERVATVELGAAKVNKDSSDVKKLKEQVGFSILKSSKSRLLVLRQHSQGKKRKMSITNFLYLVELISTGQKLVKSHLFSPNSENI